MSLSIHGWSHSAEMEFLKGLGTYSDRGAIVGRRALLYRYIRAIKNRKTLLGIDRPKAIQAARDMLRKDE